MNLMTTFKNFDSTEAIDEQIRKKAAKLEKYFLGSDIKIRWVCSKEGDLQRSDVEITGYAGDPIHASAESDDLYKTFDEVVQKISRQARKKLTKESSR